MKKITTQTLDDLTGEANASEHSIEVDGYRVSIDLTDAHYAQLMSVLDKYLDAGRRIATGSPTRRPRKAAAVPVQRTELAPGIAPKDLRAWWRTNVGKVDGLPPFKTSGRVPTNVFDAWAQTTQGTHVEV